MTNPTVSPRRAMILAAGLGERMRPLTLRRAKPALPLLNRPLVSEIARRLIGAGVDELVVNLHHRPETVREALKDSVPDRVKLIYSEESPRVLGTGGGVARARQFLEGAPFFLLNGDSLSSCDLASLVRAHRRSKALATLVARPLKPGDPYRPLEADEDGRLWRIAGRPSSPLVPPRGLKQYVFTGVHLIEPDLFEFFPSDGVFDINHDVYPAALAAGRRLFILSDESDWYEIGTPALYLAASLHLLSGGGLADAAERSVEPGIFAAPGVKGLKSAQLEAPVWIGPDSILGVGARLHRCVIGPRCEMQEGVHVEDAVLMAGSRIGRGSRLRGVVTEDGVEVPPSTDLSSQVLVRENGRLAAYSLPPPA